MVGGKGHISKSIGPFLKKRMAEERVYCRMKVTPVANKVQRAQSILGRMNEEGVAAKTAPWTPVDELLKFPNSRHDDFVDTIAWVGLGLEIAARWRNQKSKPRTKNGTLAGLNGTVSKEETR